MSINRLLAAAVCALACATAMAHARLESSDPQAATQAFAPKQVRLAFNEALEPAFSKIRIIDGQGGEVALPPTQFDKSDPRVMSAPLPPLASGTYRVQWTAMTHDSHKVKGEFTFQVK
jgi:methionine-rich copper-binding protein CopC